MDIETGTGSGIPYMDGRIITGSGETAAIRRPGNIAYSLVMSIVGEQNPSGRRIENLCGRISICQGEAATIRGPGNRVDPVRTRPKS